jgi:hypothetical protein
MSLLLKRPADADGTNVPVSTVPAAPRYSATRLHAHREKLSLEVQFDWGIERAVKQVKRRWRTDRKYTVEELAALLDD